MEDYKDNYSEEIQNTDEVTNAEVEILEEVKNTNTNWESFFKENPSKVLGTEQEITSKYGKKVIRVIGDVKKIEALNLPMVDSHTAIENITSIIVDDVKIDNITPTQLQKNKGNLKKSKKDFVKSKNLIESNKEYELFSFDEVDSRAQINDISLGLDNTLQTKRKGRSVDLARSLLTSDFRLHNHERETSRGGFGPVKWQNEVYPSPYVTLHQDMTFDDESRAMETMNIDAYFRNLKNWELDIGRRFTRDDDDLLTTQLAYTFNPKWRAVIYDRWNIDSGSWQDQQYSLVRDLHSWEVELAYKDKQGYTDNSTEIWVIFRLKAFPSVMFDGGTSYNKRKVDQNAAF